MQTEEDETLRCTDAETTASSKRVRAQLPQHVAAQDLFVSSGVLVATTRVAFNIFGLFLEGVDATTARVVE